MNRVSALSLCFLLLISRNAFGLQLPLGFTQLPSCAAAQGSDKNQNRSKPAKGISTQNVAVEAIIEGDNVEEPGNVEQLQTCATATVEKVDLKLLAAQPSESNSLFKERFLQCVKEQRIPVNVYLVVLKLDDYCEHLKKEAP